MNKERLLAVADAIENHEPQDGLGFEMSGWFETGEGTEDWEGTDCGSVACIAGWAVKIAHPEDPTYLNTMAEGLILSEGKQALGLDSLQGAELFAPDDFNLPTVTPSHAVAVIRDFVKTEEIDWTLDGLYTPNE